MNWQTITVNTKGIRNVYLLFSLQNLLGTNSSAKSEMWNDKETANRKAIKKKGKKSEQLSSPWILKLLGPRITFTLVYQLVGRGL
jgi:hypothetical protein